MTPPRRSMLSLSLASVMVIVVTLAQFVALPRLALAAGSACVLTNGDFEAAAVAPWYLQVNSDAQATVAAEANSRAAGNTAARINIGQVGSNPWNIQFSQQNVPVKLGGTYTLSFWGKASSPRTVSVALQQFDSPFVEEWTSDVALTANWQQFTFIINYPWGAKSETPLFRFDLGQSTGAIWLDDVSLCQSGNQSTPTPAPVSPNCRVTNGDFEAGSLSPWALAIESSAKADLARDAGARSATSARVTITQTGTSTQHIRLEQSGMTIRSGAWTSVQFYARASHGQMMQVALRGATGQIWQQALRLPDPAQDVAFKHYFFVFQTPQPADATATLSFDLGTNTGTVWIDAVHVCNAPVKFQDEFGGSTLDAAKWDHCKPYTNVCGENIIDGLLAWYKPDNAQVSNGTLKMKVTKETNTICWGCSFVGTAKTYKTFDYASVYVQSNFHFTTQYGFVEVRGKMPRAQGLWPAFWILPYTSPFGQWQWPPEIDILEFHSQDRNISWQGLHYNTPTKFNASDVAQYQHPDALANAFHTYAINWTPDQIIWYVDGMETFRSARYAVQIPMGLVLSVDVGGLAGPPPSDADLPIAVTEVDYVRAFDNGEAFAFTPSTPGPSPTPNPKLKSKVFLPALLHH